MPIELKRSTILDEILQSWVMCDKCKVWMNNKSIEFHATSGLIFIYKCWKCKTMRKFRFSFKEDPIDEID